MASLPIPGRGVSLPAPDLMATCPMIRTPSFVVFPLCAGLLAAQGDFIPTLPETVINTALGNGVLVYRDIIVNPGITVRGIGPRPLVLIATRNVVVRGTITVSGADGADVMTLNSANFPAPGGQGGAGGGRGGSGSPNSLGPSLAGESGYDAAGAPVGGLGGSYWAATANGRGSGGGGGAFGSVGDPHLYPTGVTIPQIFGIGGLGGPGPSAAPTRTLSGGGAGSGPFVDQVADNNFFGYAIDVARNRIVQGELAVPMGGQGGGGGGDLAGFTSNWVDDSSGGGGGGGGGCLVLFAGGYLAVLGGGSIHADGGAGGGGEQAGSSNEGGGGGGGSGGMVILASQTAIALEVIGETYGNDDYRFVVSADGGGCRSSVFGNHPPTKYPANGVPVTASQATLYDAEPRGGYGGLGVVQLVAPAGGNADGTNTVLDDGILLVRNGSLLFGTEKRRFLAWRGFQNQLGVFVDDYGAPTLIGPNEGDIRPSPVLMPMR